MKANIWIAATITLLSLTAVNGAQQHENLVIRSQEDFELAFKRTQKLVAVNDVFQVRPQVFAMGPGDGDNDSDDECPPCFNCNLPNFECTQFSQCNTFTGMCECRDGYGGMDCSEPLCGSLTDGNSKRPVRGNDTCDCKEGWGGINCNMCTTDRACDPFMPEGLKGTCYKSGIIVKKFHQMCDVTNKKIISILNGKKPQATFSCNATAEMCDFQFWIAEEESFYCELGGCKLDYDLNANTTHYNCETVKCKCLPDKMLCGQKGSIDISDFLTETIKGPGDFTCDVNAKSCRFSEPSMNQLIQSVFGDPYITLHCNSGECIHKSEIPGYTLPPKPRFTLSNMLLIGGFGFLCAILVVTSIYNIGKSPLFRSTDHFDCLESELHAMNENFTPATLAFKNVSYKVSKKGNHQQILSNIFGIVQPGESLAIMGGSGAGKTTLLDILAGKFKAGQITGDIYVNGTHILPKDYKKIIGFVDQEDHLIPTLTVYETVLNSALLRLPRDMSLRAKEARVIEVLNELRIFHIKDRVIGSDFERGISGGEKRRVSIACELVTSPSILFLDEPTSGLDAYNARNVVDVLVKLARDFNRTIVFTIHQPRSNIVSLFDNLVLLNEGDLVYSGAMIACNDFFASNGYKCPVGYNIADYLIDVTVNQKKVISTTQSEESVGISSGVSLEGDDHIHAEFLQPTTASTPSAIDTQMEWEHFAVHRDEYNEHGNTKVITIKNKLPLIFDQSQTASEIRALIAREIENRTPIEFNNRMFKRATIGSQILILSSRTFKNLYRNPRLLLSHYVLSLVMGLFCGYLYYDVSNDISGFQNRLGLFFFLLTLFGFSCLTGLHAFSSERIIFIRERANNYYHPSSYYISKIVCDVLPLRVLPPIILLSIAYPLVGLTMEHNGFLKAIMVLILFNVAVAIEVLIVGILIREPGTSTMVGVLILLFSLLFAGLFINSEDVKSEIKVFQILSLFHYAYESLTINEVKDLILKEKKYGLSIEVPGAVILSTFGFDVSAFWIDVSKLAGFAVAFLILGYIFLHKFTIEKR